MNDFPGLKRVKRKGGDVALYWVAANVSREAADYPTPTVRIHAGNDDEIAAFCQRYTAELKRWLADRAVARGEVFDGTIRALIDLYRANAESPYRAVKANTQRMYDESLDLLREQVGDVSLASIKGSTFRRWYDAWRAPASTGGPERMRRAFKAIKLMRIIVGFGITEDVPECARLKAILDEMRFSKPAPRKSFVTFAQSQAIIDTAIELGRPSVAIAQALQFELTLRQVDVIGQWERFTGKPHGITSRGQRWSGGVLWSDIDGEGVLRKITTKTGQEAIHDTTRYPLLRRCLDLVAADSRVGPIIICETTGLPYRYRHFAEVWREVATAAGVPTDIWSRDSRAGGVTEGTDAGVDLEMMRHHANHSNAATTAIYSRRTLEKTRAVADARIASRTAANS